MVSLQTFISRNNHWLSYGFISKLCELFQFNNLIIFITYFQTLPKVPVPPLEQTMTDYIRALEPITSTAQLERTKAIIKQFTAPNGLGPRLHQYLTDKREAEDNWVSSIAIGRNNMYFQNRYILTK